MFCFQKYTRHLLRLIFSPQDLQQSLSLETNPVDNAVPCFPHDNVVGNRLCDEYVRNQSCQASVTCLNPFCDWSRKLVDWPQDIRSSNSCQVPAFQDNFASKLLTILQMIRVPPAWIDDHPGKGLRLCTVAPFSCLLIRSITQRIVEHVLPCRKATLLFVREVFPIPVIFSVAPAEKRDSNIFLYCSIIVSFGLHSRWVHPKYTSSRKAIICFFPVILMSSTYTHTNTPCLRWTNMHSHFRIFSHPSSDKASSNCLFHDNPANGWLCKLSPRGTTRSSIVPMILAICVVEDVSKHLNTLIWEFRAILEHLQILPECQQILHQLLVHHHLVILQ